MLSLLFVICMIWFIGKFFIFGVKASWGILKLLCTVVFFPVILIGMVVGGLIYIAFPLLIIGGIIALISSNSVGQFLRTVHTCYPFLFSAPAFALV